MAKILKYVGKGEWIEINENEIAPSDRTQKSLKKRLSEKEKIERFFNEVNNEIINNGYKSIKVSTLLDKFGIKRRTPNNVNLITEKLKENGLHSMPEFSKELKIDDTIRLYNYPVKQLGELFSSEKSLENYIYSNSLYKKLNIESVIRQHSPKGTKDRLDFKGSGKNDEIIVLELKNGGGGKSAVEQVLRYAGLLKAEYPNKKIRQILVTGIQNYETALAIRGMQKEQRKLFEWYLYKYHKDINYFDFVKISNNEID